MDSEPNQKDYKIFVDLDETYALLEKAVFFSKYFSKYKNSCVLQFNIINVFIVLSQKMLS
jgi:hypothetical protein